MRANDIHAAIGSKWPLILQQFGVGESYFRGPRKPGPCPICGGRDRFVGDNRRNRGDYFCRRCGAGDGFALLMKLTGQDFATIRKRVMEVAGLAEGTELIPYVAQNASASDIATPTSRVRDILRSACDPADVDDVREYLAARRLWPLPEGCRLKAHASVEYWNDERQRVGRFPALVAPIRDIDGELVTAHVTYLSSGWKLATHEPRKLLSKLTGRVGCAVQLMPLSGDVLGVAEGIETALSALRLNFETKFPIWPCLNTALLSRFEPPPQVRSLIVFADRDVPGLEAAAKLMQTLQGRVQVELRAPPAPAKDFNDVLMETPS